MFIFFFGISVHSAYSVFHYFVYFFCTHLTEYVFIYSPTLCRHIIPSLLSFYLDCHLPIDPHFIIRFLNLVI